MVRKFSQDRIKEELPPARAPLRKEDPRMREGRERKDGEKKSRKTDLENPADRFCVRECNVCVTVCARGCCTCVTCILAVSLNLSLLMVPLSSHLSSLRLC